MLGNRVEEGALGRRDAEARYVEAATFGTGSSIFTIQLAASRFQPLACRLRSFDVPRNCRMAALNFDSLNYGGTQPTSRVKINAESLQLGVTLTSFGSRCPSDATQTGAPRRFVVWTSPATSAPPAQG